MARPLQITINRKGYESYSQAGKALGVSRQRVWQRVQLAKSCCISCGQKAKGYYCEEHRLRRRALTRDYYIRKHAKPDGRRGVR